MRTSTLLRLTAGLAAAAALVYPGAAAAAPAKAADEDAGVGLPGFPEPASAARSAVFSNACYEAWIATNGHLYVVLQKDGKPAGPSFRLFSTGIWANDAKGGFAYNMKVQSLTADSKMPVRQPTAPVRFRFEGEKSTRGSVEILFEARSISVDVKFRPPGPPLTAALSSAAWFNAIPGVSPGKATSCTNLAALCAGRSIDLVPEKADTFSLPFADDARDLPLCAEWVIHGMWDGYALRGKVASKGQTFRLWQYAGTKPAEGFAMVYSLSKTLTSRKVVFTFESTDAAAQPAGPAGRLPGARPGSKGPRRP